MDVVLIRWPGEEARREVLQRAGRPRLLLVEREVPAPDVDDCFEDWVRVPADESDVRARIDALTRRAAVHGRHDPDLDSDGLLHFGEKWVSLPPVEARLMTALIARYGAVVSREQLARSGWPEGSPGRNALDVHVLRLRRRISEMGLAIKTVRSRGYLLEAAPVPSNGHGGDAHHASDTSQQAVRNA